MTAEGKILVESGTYTYQYHLSDHLGNIRVAFSDASGDSIIQVGTEIDQTADYYPFGLAHDNSANQSDATQKYLYNGKELQEGTDWLDYGARMYDASLGRWHVIDPLCERLFSEGGYNYVINNPMKYIDPDGRWFWEKKHIRKARKWAKKNGGEVIIYRNEAGEKNARVEKGIITYNGNGEQVASGVSAKVFTASSNKKDSKSNEDWNPLEGPGDKTKQWIEGPWGPRKVREATWAEEKNLRHDQDVVKEIAEIFGPGHGEGTNRNTVVVDHDFDNYVELPEQQRDSREGATSDQEIMENSGGTGDGKNTNNQGQIITAGKYRGYTREVDDKSGYGKLTDPTGDTVIMITPYDTTTLAPFSPGVRTIVPNR